MDLNREKIKGQAGKNISIIIIISLFFFKSLLYLGKKDSYYNTIAITSPSISLNLGTNVYSYFSLYDKPVASLFHWDISRGT